MILSCATHALCAMLPSLTNIFYYTFPFSPSLLPLCTIASLTFLDPDPSSISLASGALVEGSTPPFVADPSTRPPIIHILHIWRLADIPTHEHPQLTGSPDIQVAGDPILFSSVRHLTS